MKSRNPWRSKEDGSRHRVHYKKRSALARQQYEKRMIKSWYNRVCHTLQAASFVCVAALAHKTGEFYLQTDYRLLRQADPVCAEVVAKKIKSVAHHANQGLLRMLLQP